MNDENKTFSREGIIRVNDNDKNPHLSVDDPGDGSEAALEADEIETETTLHFQLPFQYEAN